MRSDNVSDYEVPDESFVKSVLAKLGDLQHRRAFYAGLNNPNWVRALDAAHAFNSVPASRIDDDGYLRGSPWPEGSYLVRMAPSRPDEVTNVLGRLTETDDPYLHRLLLSAAANLPAQQAKMFVPSIVRALAGNFHNFMDATEVVAVIKRLAEGREFTAASTVANAAYRPKSDGNPLEGNGFRRRNVRVGVDESWYRETLPTVVSALAPEGLKWLATLRSWLQQYQFISGHAESGNPRDTSAIWRPSIGPHDYNRDFEPIGNSLVDAVRDLSLQLVESGSATVEDLQKNLNQAQQSVFERISLFVVTRLVSQEHSDSLEVGFRCLMDTHFLQPWFRHEYVELATAVLPTLTPDQSGQWELLIDAGPPISTEEMDDRASFWRKPDETLADARSRYREEWQIDLLAGIRTEALPAKSAATYRQLQSRYGSPAHPGFLIGPIEFEPVDFSEHSELENTVNFEDMPIDEILATIRSESMSDVSSIPVTASKLRNSMEAASTHRPVEFATRAVEFIDMNLSYVGPILSGLRQSDLQSITAQGWDAISRVGLKLTLGFAANQPDGLLEWTSELEYAQQAFISLVEQAASATLRGLPLGEFLNALTILAGGGGHPVQRADEASGTDPLTASRIDVHARALFAIICLAGLQLSNAAQEEAEPHLLARTLSVLANHTGPNRNPSLAFAASFGRGLGLLLGASRDWVDSFLPQLLVAPEGKDMNYSDVAITTALVSFRPSLSLYNELRPYLSAVNARISAGEPILLGWSQGREAAELIGDHAVFLFVIGAIDIRDDLLIEFFATASTENRASVIGQLGWSLSNAKKAPTAAVNRAIELFDWRVDEFESGRTDAREFLEFESWTVSEIWPEEWWIKHLETLVGKVDFDRHGIIASRLAHASRSHPLEAVKILSALLAEKPQQHQRYALVNYAPTILAAALDCGSVEAQSAAQALQERLGRDGELSIRERVEQARRRPDGASSKDSV